MCVYVCARVRLELKSPSVVRNASTYKCDERVEYEFYFLSHVKKKKKKIKKNVMTGHGAPPWYAFVVVGPNNLFYRYGVRNTTFGVTCTVFFST